MKERSFSSSAAATRSGGTKAKKRSKKRSTAGSPGSRKSASSSGQRKRGRASSSGSRRPKRRLVTMGLDLSLTGTAVVVWDGQRVLHFRLLPTAPDPKGLGPRVLPGGSFQGDDEARIEHIVRHIRGCFRKFRPDLVAIEGHSFGSRGRGLSVLHELAGVVKNFLCRHEAPFVIVPPQSLKKLFTGDGRASKQQMITEAQRFWPDMLPIDDLADAFALAKVSGDDYTRLVIEVDDELDEGEA